MNKKITVLLVEDSLSDVRLIEESFKEAQANVAFSIVEDGEKAIKFLKKQDEFSNESTPNVIILDLNLPKKNGFEVLSEIRKDPKLDIIPVIILSSSNDQYDIDKSYSNFANSYIIKPYDLNDYLDLAKNFDKYWFKTISLPTNKS